MLAVDGTPMSHEILCRYLRELQAASSEILYQDQYIHVYDNARTRLTGTLRLAVEYCAMREERVALYRRLRSIFLQVDEATCRDRLTPACWAKFQCCKQYLQYQTAPRTPSPHRERRGKGTPEPDKRPMRCLLRRLLASA